MSDDSEIATREAPHSRGRSLAIAAAVLVVVLAAAIAATSSQPVGTPGPSVDPSATLDAALAAGEPVYVLIHSLT